MIGGAAVTGEPNADYVCAPCLAAWGEGYDCARHTPRVQAVARDLAEHFGHGPEPTTEQVGWFMEDAEAIAEDYPDDPTFDLVFLGEQADGRVHFTVNGHRWAEPDLNAEGFNPCTPMWPCPHPYGHDTEMPCEECRGSGWIAFDPAQIDGSGSL